MGAHVRGGPGIRVKSGPHGITISSQRSARARAGVARPPFYIYNDGLIHAGTVNSVIPTLEDTPIGEDGHDLTMTGDFYVYIKASFDLTFGTFNFLTAATLKLDDPLTIVTSASPLVDALDVGGTALDTYRLVAQVIDGIVQREQPTKTNLFLSICDLSDGTEEGKNVGAGWHTS